MSSLMGIPMGIADESITAELPSFSGRPQREATLEIQIGLSKVLAQIHGSKSHPPIVSAGDADGHLISRVWRGRAD